MPFVPATNVVELHLRATLHGEMVENVLNFAFTTSPAAALQDIANSAETNWRTHVLPELSQDYLFREVYAADQTTQFSGVATAPTSPPVPGGRQTGSMPGSVAFCITHRTANRGRNARGRTYLCGLPEQEVTGNTVNLVYADVLVAKFINFIGGVEVDTGGQFSIVSRRVNGVDLGLATVRTVTQVLARDNRVDSQRRRLAGRGQ